MESSAIGVIEERLRNLDTRQRSTHDGLGEARKEQATLDKKQALQDAAIVDLREDMADLRRSVNRLTAAAIVLATSAVGSAVTIALSTGSHP